MKRRALIIVATMVAAPAHAQANLTLHEARALSTEALAARILGETGALVRESEVKSGFPPFSSADNLYEIEFASAPRSAGFPGLCEADIYSVEFAPGIARPGGAIASTVHALRTLRRYQRVADPEPLADGWSGDYGRRLDALCAAATPVLSRSGGYFAGSFRQSGDFWPTHAAFAIRALARAQTWAGPIGCTDERAPSRDLCAGARALIAPLDPATLGYFTVDACNDRPETYCVGVTFPRDRTNSDSNHVVTLTIATDTIALNGPVGAFAVRWVAIEGSSFVN